MGARWTRLNFPTEREVKRAQERGALAEAAMAEAAMSERHRPSAFCGVGWHKKRRKWTAQIKHDKKLQYFGCFDNEREAARAVDTAARRLRGVDAHGAVEGARWTRLNFPTEWEVKRAQERGAPL